MVSQKSTLKTEAVFSDDGKHRFLLHKEWDKTKKSALVIMKNPSQANIVKLDATTMYVINNLLEMDYGAVYIANLFSVMTDKLRFWNKMPEDLVVPENDAYIQKSAEKADIIILAWGIVAENNRKVQVRKQEILELLQAHQDKFFSIRDSYGHKRLHPLSPYVRYEWILEKFCEEEGEETNDNTKKS